MSPNMPEGFFNLMKDNLKTVVPLFIGFIIGVITMFLVMRPAPGTQGVGLDPEAIKFMKYEDAKNCPEVGAFFKDVKMIVDTKLVPWHRKLIASTKDANTQKYVYDEAVSEQLTYIEKTLFKLYLIVEQELPGLCKDESKKEDIHSKIDTLKTDINNYLSQINTNL